MLSQSAKAEAFRSLHTQGHPLILYNVWDAGSSKMVAESGAKAIATSSWAVAAAHGMPDGEHIPLDLVIRNLQRIVGVTDLPVTVDLESGYGEDAQSVGVTVARAIKAGAIGCNLEDSRPDTRLLREPKDQAQRIDAARAAVDKLSIPAFINARTDIFFQEPQKPHTEIMLNDALKRADVYASAGADGFFVPGLTSPLLIRRLVKESPLPVNIMVGSNTPSTKQLAKFGVARVSYGPEPYFIAMKALEEAARNAFA